MNKDELKNDGRPRRICGLLTGWEDVIFELDDAPDDLECGGHAAALESGRMATALQI